MATIAAQPALSSADFRRVRIQLTAYGRRKQNI
jgi:hypothetical protein